MGAKHAATGGHDGLEGGGWRRRGLLLLLAILLAGGALAAALGGGSPLAIVPGNAAPVPGLTPASQSATGALSARALGAGAHPDLSQRLAAMGMPADLAGLAPFAMDLGSVPGTAAFEPLPLPEPDADEPLRSAIRDATSTLGLPAMPAIDLEVALAQVDLGAAGQRALAQLLLAYAEAVSLRREATATLTPDERALLALDEQAVAAWFAQDGSRTWTAFEQEALRIVAEKVDANRTMQAADLLVRAVEASRAALASDARPAPAQAPTAAPPRSVDVAGVAPATVPDAAAMSFGEAWAALNAGLGVPIPPSGGPSPHLHPTLESALAPLLAAKAQGLRTDDAMAEAGRAYDAARGAQPTLEAWGALLRMDARRAPAPAPAMAAVPLGTPAQPLPDLDPFRRALDEALRGLGDADRAALLEGPRAQSLLGRDEWTPTEAGLVRDWARAHEALPDPALRMLQETASPLAVLADGDGDGCPDVVQATQPLACSLARLARAEGTPLPAPVPLFEPQPASSPVPAPGLLFDDATAGPQSALCEAEPDGTCVGPASVLRIGGTDAQTYTWPAVIQVDLGGDDRHVTEVAGPAVVRPRGACADGGPAGKPCVPPPCASGGPCALPAGSYAIDVEGDDEYATPGRNLTQGATFGRGASLLLDLAGDDVYQADQRSQGFGGKGLGLLVDLAGNDRYEAGPVSQGAAQDLLGGNLVDGAVTVGELFVPSWGSLADLAGDDHYAFTQQGSLLDAIGVATVFDANGTDTYASTGQPFDAALLATSPGLAFLTQGRFAETAPGLAAGLALFADRGLERDAYLALGPEGGLQDVSAAKNQQVLRPNGANPTSLGEFPGYGFFHDGDPVDLDERRDHDSDGVPTAAEKALGTDPADSSSNPGNLFHVLTGGTLGEPGATGVAGMDRPGPWLATPNQLQVPNVGSVALPGIIIGGRGDDTHAAWVPFLVDLGGDDAYVAPYAGGASPMATGLFTSQHRLSDLPPTDVTLLLDVGATPEGHDTYAPDPAPCTITRGDANSYVSGAGDAAIRSTAGVFPAACPALGGAHNGIALLADDGGHNAFRSSLSIDVNANTQAGAPAASVANVTGYGVMQGAALFDGVGLLLSWDADNDFTADVRVRAAESGTTAFGPFAPGARALGLSQGAALGGVGLLSAMGPAGDTYQVNVTGQATQGSGRNAAVVRGASQGAGLSGVGILLDEGGADSWLSSAGSSQGYAAGSPQPTNTIAGGSPSALGRPGAAGMQGPNGGLGTASRPALGLLWTGGGDDLLQAGPSSQGAATGYDNYAASVIGNLEPYVGGSAGLGLLVDTGGNDQYHLAPGSGQRGLGQGAGASHGVGVLLELDGDDVYDAAGTTHVQGAGVRGVGVLEDRGGHDRYLALARSQGYGEHDGVDASRMAFGTPAPVQGLMVAARSWDLSDPGVTLGLLRDESGWDAYQAESASQGAAAFVLHDLGDVQSCASSVLINGGVAAAACDQNDQHCANLNSAQANVDLCNPPGSCPAGASTGPCEDTPNRRQCLSVSTTRPCLDTSTRIACPGPCPKAVVGLLLDGGGDDAYEYAGAKCDLEAGGACAPGPIGGDGWSWTQGTPMPSVVGLGADDATIDAALAAAIALLPPQARGRLPVDIQVGVAADAAGTQPLAPGETARGTVHLVADVQVRQPLSQDDVQRVDFLVDGRLVGAGAPVAGTTGRYVLAWATRAPQDDGMAQRVPDGVHSIVASAFVSQDAPSARTGRAALSSPTFGVESAEHAVEVDNPPLLSLQLDSAVVASDLGIGARLDLALGPDAQEAGQVVRVTVVRDSDGQSWDLDEAPRLPGVFGYTLDGDECGGDCADGRHTLVASARDGRGQTTTVLGEVVYDRLAPSSKVTLPSVAADEHRAGANGLVVVWSHSDDPEGLGAGNGSGVARVHVLLLDDDGEVTRDLGEHDGRVTQATALGMFSGDALRFITVASDAVGHSESPCLVGEPSPCYRAKLARPQAVQEVLLDYGRPVLSDLTISRVHVPPGGQATFSVRASDAESGLAAVDLRFDQGFPDAPLLPVANGVYRAVVQALPAATGSVPAERPFVFTAAAVDQAGNERLRSGVGVLDDRPPRLAPQPLAYGAAGAQAAQSPSLVRATVRVQDVAVAWVGLNATALLGPRAPLDCALDAAANLWACDLVVPEGTADGPYDLQWEARDAAGNVNRSATSRLEVSGSRPRLAGIEVHRLFHDGFALRWTSDLPGTARLQYGRDDRTESVASNATCAAAPDACDPFEHEVEVRGLPSATDFFARVVTVGRSGLANASEVMVVRTGNSFLLATPDLEPADALRGLVQLRVDVTSLDGSPAPVALSVLLQDEGGRASPRQVHQQTVVPGSATLEVDSRQVADGQYNLILSGIRSGERSAFTVPLVRVDNTEPVLSPIEPRPGSRVADATPRLVLSLLDPAAAAPMALEGLAVLVDGQAVEATVRPASAWSAGAPQRVEILVQEPLPQGARDVAVEIIDGAGNLGRATWSFVVDTQAPAVRSSHVAYPAGQGAVAPGGAVQLSANLTDPSGVASMAVEAQPPVSFLDGGSGTWTARLAVPSTRPDGPWDVPVVVTDRLGNAGRASIPVVVDARAPGVVAATAEPAGPTSVRLQLQADEPVALRATSGGSAAEGASRSREHQLLLTGLAPGQTHAIVLELTDRAGNRASFLLNGTTQGDEEAPGPVVLNATSPQEGVVVLDWSAARDNAGVRAYRVERRVDTDWVALAEVGANRTSFEDTQAPLGRMARYRVTAVDVAGLASPSTETLVRVLALPHLAAGDVQPRVARSDQDVTFSIVYRHGSGRPPDEARVTYMDLVVPLQPVDVEPDCTAGCRLEGSARLPPAVLGGPAPQAVFVAVADGQVATLALGDGPRVLGHDQALRPAGASVPAPGAFPILAALLAVALLVRQRNPRT